MIPVARISKIIVYALVALLGLFLVGVIMWLNCQDDWYLMQRRARKEWFEEQKTLARSSEVHLRDLAAQAVDFANTDEWQRNSSRLLISTLVRLPGEPVEPLLPPNDPQRWKRVVEALSSESATLHFESQAGVWVVDYAGGTHREESEEVVDY